MRKPMNPCKTCEHAVFDPLWGEYKCTVKEHYIYGDIEHECPDHKEGTPAISKDIDVESN